MRHQPLTRFRASRRAGQPGAQGGRSAAARRPLCTGPPIGGQHAKDPRTKPQQDTVVCGPRSGVLRELASGLSIQQRTDRRTVAGRRSRGIGGRALCARRTTTRVMVMMVVVHAAGALRVLLQRGKGALCAGKVAGLERVLRSLQIVCDGVGRCGRVGCPTGRLGGLLPVILPSGEGLLRPSQVAGFEGAGQGPKVLRTLFEGALDGRLICRCG